MNVIELTKELIRFNTINPPGNEEEIALYLGDLLSKNGFSVNYPRFDKQRLHIIAEKGITAESFPIVLSGHLDVVPLGSKKWNREAFVPEIENGKLFGRGSSDIKGGVAAIVCAAINVYKDFTPQQGIRLIITAAEEIGCLGVRDLYKKGYDIGKASGLIIAEPSSNIPLTGHKGAVSVNAYTKGLSAHSSMPEKGDNAIYKAAQAIIKLQNLNFNAKEDKLLGLPTINIGTIKGGANFNSVPDKAEFTIDVRTTGEYSNQQALEQIKEIVGKDVKIEPFVNLRSYFTSETEDFVKVVYKVCTDVGIKAELPASAPYLTDASVLQAWYNNVPTVILGPGEADMAHKTDEFCYVDKIIQAELIYKNIITDWEK